MKLPDFEYKAPTTVEEAVALLAASEGSARLLAGGQSLLPVMAFRLAEPSALIDLSRIPGLDRIEIDERGLRLGPMVTWRMIEKDARIAAACPLLSAAVAHIAHYQIRNRGTAGGSLAHADPAAELPMIALACEAAVEATSPRGRRSIPAKDLFLGPLTTSLEPDEMIVSIAFPSWSAGRRWAFEEFSRRRGDFALAAIAVHYDEDADGAARNVHVGAIGAADAPVRLSSVEALLDGRRIDSATIAEASAAAKAEADPSGDQHGGVAYRKSLVATLLQRALARAATSH